ncbi:MAG TPA: ATP-binding protein [Pyrinomonadaceae bacterium]|nr:ATP-binding protein [Pyrinomonadaceae bacterium]
MNVRVFHTLSISDDAQVGAARRAVRRFASPLGFNEGALAELDIVVQEIGTNAARYATSGGCLHWTTPLGRAPGVELFYWDKGPGIFDVERAILDGVSSGGSLGGGLGALQRLLDEFDVYSTVRGTTSRLVRRRRTTHGTAILGRKWVAPHARDVRSADDSFDDRIGAWSRPRAGEDVNGDAYYIRRYRSQTLFAVIDGLGHGRGAHEAASVALDSLAQWQGEPLAEMLHAAHDALRATRGAVVGAIILDRENEAFHYAGVGNIEARVFGSDEPARPIPNNGTLGVRLPPNLRVWPHRWTPGATIVLASDGLSATWDIGAYPGLLRKSPQLIAGVLLRDFGRDTDDATVMVVK